MACKEAHPPVPPTSTRSNQVTRRAFLEIEPGGDVIAGWITVETNARERFCGWIDLAAAVERLRDAPER